ncbi:conserved hypothetical protein [Mesorhizobium plurifarium]|uniref:Transposase n=1 Tax=Mesorhizobium plurifarium TaxID=69974 RepID=A0A0K2VTU9_MESPL|nr:conserved hypothetical protein [Mesorhizobium plurifarium]
MSNGQSGRHLQQTARVRIPLVGGLSAWLGAQKGWSCRLRPWLHPSLRIMRALCVQWLEAMRGTRAARAIGARIAAQRNQHLTPIADAMAAR